jgi:16S rRNA (cytosine1407-C5)-methyltransferase
MRKAQVTDHEKARLAALLDHLEKLLPDADQAHAFRAAILTLPLPTARFNPLITQLAALPDRLASLGQAVAWCPDAFTLNRPHPALGNTLEHLLGGLYIQAKATTLAVEVLQPQPHERVLDLAAAPGGKTTQIAARMANTGLLVANEPNKKRMPALVGNLERCGIFNTVLTQAPGTLLARYFHNYFDRVLLDAPCSGDGIIAKDRAMLGYWSPLDASHKANQQLGLLRAAFHMLRPGGTLVYSTCSLSVEENEEVLAALMRTYPDQFDMQPINALPPTPLPQAIAARYPTTLTHMRRVWPHLHQTEGACIAKLKKKQQPTLWAQEDGDATTWPAATTQTEAVAAKGTIECQWDFSLPSTGDHILINDQRHLHIMPPQGPAFKEHLPFFLKAGMHLTRHHKGHHYLAHQAIALWGHTMQRPALALTWSQTQQLFAGKDIVLAKPISLKGEVVCRLGPLTVCRALVKAEGYAVQGMVPKSTRRQTLNQLSITDADQISVASD